jgi:hypothetical protein
MRVLHPAIESFCRRAVTEKPTEALTSVGDRGTLRDEISRDSFRLHLKPLCYELAFATFMVAKLRGDRSGVVAETIDRSLTLLADGD